jgi:pimeloyl-ACP methyl ester carboxylesterase
MCRWRFFLVSTILLAGCQRPTRDAQLNEGLSVSKYIKRTNAEAVIVFVPGLYGDAAATWTNDTTHAYWPEMVARDPGFQGSDVYVYGRPAVRSQSINDMVEDLNLQLTNDEVFAAHKRVIFVCHSLGGTIVKAYLLRYRNQAAHVPLLFLLSTPSTGAALSRLVGSVQGSSGISPLLNDSNGYLASLSQDWRAAHLPLLTRCVFETRPTSGVLVVSREDASSDCDGPAEPVDKDHTQIAKPASSSDSPYTIFQRAFQNDANKTSTPVPQFVTETIGSEPVYFELGCGESKTFQYKLAPSRPLRPNQQIAAATPALQDVANLKDVQIRSIDYSATDATVVVGASGLDRDFTGNCRAGGHGRVVVTFVVTGPAN